jgi:hypothetical protein
MRTRAPLFAVAILSLSLAWVPSARAAGEPTETIEQLAEQAYSLQAAGKNAEAITVYLRAYEISKDAILLLNVATIYDRKMNEPALAAEYYRRYLIAPDAEGERVKGVTDRLAVLKREAEEDRAKMVAAPAAQPAQPAAPPPAPVTATPPAPAAGDSGSHGSGVRVAGIVVGLVGVAGLATSFALGGVAKSKNDEANAVCNGRACQNQNGVDLARSAESFATGSTVAFVAGLTFIAGGITLYAVAPRGEASNAKTSVMLSPRVDRSGGGFVLQGAF